MLQFEAEPDPIFRVIVEEALAHLREELYPFAETYTPTEDDLTEEDDKYRDLYDRLAALFTREEALEVVNRLRSALSHEQLYALTDYHRLVLHDALEMFCDLHNDNVFGNEGQVGPYVIARIDLGHILDVYFPDTDFLMGPLLLRSEENRPGEFGFTRAAWRIAAGLRPRSEDLALTPIAREASTMEPLEPPTQGWPTAGYIGSYPLAESGT